jgi:lipid A 3-O-deacylase
MRRALVIASVLIAAGSAAAADPALDAPALPTLTPEAQSQSFISEFRFGAFGHTIDNAPEMGSIDINAEILFNKPITSSDPWIEALLPRPHIGATLNTAGDTSQAYAGLTWTFNLTDRLFLEGTFGGSINNGFDGPAARVPVDRNELGCNILFRESASLGFQITQNWNVMGTIEHSSHAGLCEANRGLTNAGVRFGYKF